MKEIKCSFLDFKYQALNLNHVIRIGAIRDGGYFVTKRLVEDSEILISGGISYNVAFEKDFWDINRTAKLIMIDGSFNLFTYLARPFYWMIFKRSFTMKIGGLIDMLYLKKKAIFVKKYLGIRYSLKNIFDEYVKREKKVYLKLDIEGSEYDLLDDIISYQDKICGLAIEFHNVPDHIPEINKFLIRLQKCLIGFSINETAKLNASGLPNVIELCFADNLYVEIQDTDKKAPKIFSNEHYNELLIPFWSEGLEG